MAWMGDRKVAEAFHEHVAGDCAVPRVATKHLVAARSAPVGAHRRTALARFRAEVSRITRRGRFRHWTVRRAANAARRALRLSRRLADGPLGTAPLAALVQRAVTGRLRPSVVLAALARLGAGRVSVPGVERAVVAGDVHPRGHLAGGRPA